MIRCTSSGLLLWVVIVLSPLAQADIASSRALANDPQWRALLHFARSPNGYAGESAVDDTDFFLSPAGKTDAHAELLATVAQLTQNPGLRCRFIARFHWLQQNALLDSNLQAACTDYTAWRREINAGAVALVFAASYLNSPSSMYGHTFLRIDPKGYRSESALLSYAVNYAALVPANDNSVMFAWRGMTGGYPGHFSLQPYIEKLQEYSRLENRDIWEYELNLTAPEIDRLMAHLWELQAINFDYYFMDENCSYRLLELLEVARPGVMLTHQFPLHAIPVDTVRAVDEAGLIEGRVYRPSRQRELQAMVSPLSSEQQQWVLALAENPAQSEAPDFQSKSAQEQAALLLGAYRLLRYRHNREARTEGVATRSFALLRAMNQLPASAQQAPPIEQPEAPDSGHPTALTAIALGRFAAQDYQELSFRLTYHDLLDPLPGYPGNASLNMLQATVRHTEDGGTRLQSLNLVDIRSLAPRSTFFKPVSWQVRAGLERSEWQPAYLAPFVSAGAGGSWRAARWDFSALAVFRGEYNEVFDENWQAAPGLALRLGRQGQRWAVALDAEHYRFFNAVERNAATLSLNLALTPEHGLRVSARRLLEGEQGDNAFSAQWRYYF